MCAHASATRFRLYLRSNRSVTACADERAHRYARRPDGRTPRRRPDCGGRVTTTRHAKQYWGGNGVAGRDQPVADIVQCGLLAVTY
jgi:hypothetical protein